MKKIFSFVIVMAAVAMVSCGGNTNKKAAEAAATRTETTDCSQCAEKCDSTKAYCGESGCGEADTTKTCCGEAK